MQIACFDSQLTNNCMQIFPLGEGMTRRFCICIELLQREIFLCVNTLRPFCLAFRHNGFLETGLVRAK